MNNVELSIIIPHYNSPDKLKRMLESIPMRDEIQVVVVDDISTQKLDELNELKEVFSRVEFYENTPDNKCAGGARNLGIKKAKGKWILFGDADDYFTADMFETVEPFFDSEYDAVFFRMQAYIDDGSRKESDRCHYYTTLAKNYSKKYNKCKDSLLKKWKIAPIEREMRMGWVSPCAKMVRRELIEREKIEFEFVRIAEDNFFAVQVGCKAKKVFAVDHLIYCVLDSEGSLSKTKDPETVKLCKDIWDRCLEYIEKNESKSLKFRATVAQKLWGIK